PSADATDAVAVIDAVEPTGALHGSVMDGEHGSVTLPQRDHLGARLHSRPLLGKNELASFEVVSGLRQQGRHLQGEYVLAVKILMQTVVITFPVLQQQRRRAALARHVATLEELGVTRRKPYRVAQLLIPSVGNGCQARIEHRPQARNHG